MIESLNPYSNDVTIEVRQIRRTTDISVLIDLGMRTTDLVRRGVSEFLTANGSQYRVTLMDPKVYVAQKPNRLKGAFTFANVKGNA